MSKPPVCVVVEGNLAEYARGNLPNDERLNVAEHLNTCTGCTLALQAVRTALEPSKPKEYVVQVCVRLDEPDKLNHPPDLVIAHVLLHALRDCQGKRWDTDWAGGLDLSILSVRTIQEDKPTPG